MTLLQSKDGIQYFTFEHSRDYQQIQFKFLDAVKSMDPNNIVVYKSESVMWLCNTPYLRLSPFILPGISDITCDMGWQKWSFNEVSMI